MACERPAQLGLPLSRLSMSDLAHQAVQRGLVAQISRTTVWRWLGQDALRPWYHRSWMFPRDPKFREKARRVLDLYEGFWQEKPLRDGDFVLSADEKTSIQARARCHSSLPTGPGQSTRVEHEYDRAGALVYLAAWDVRRAKLFGRCQAQSGIVPFDQLVAQVMGQEPYRSAQRVFWIIDNGSSHRGEKSVQRLQRTWPNLIPVHLPIHASWLNQIEIYFSILQRKALTPNDFPSLSHLEEQILSFQTDYERRAKPFQWKFTRSDLDQLLDKIVPQTKAA